ncbi:hypothetical protein JYU34_013295 [Plutella xylostella]|uniref:Reverse transcriptase domain-containing protein n=2 Tax=Plutella xylostella TaxID=51655 RepID=A0ABQ7Q9H7_PLUXY|nr:hypothetical protein JYU34_013295 [Plutella xylostella]
MLQMYKDHYTTNHDIKELYMEYKSKFNKEVRAARRDCINSTIAHSSNISRSLWTVIKSETCKGPAMNPLTILQKCVLGPSGSARSLACRLNEYYISVVRDTALRPRLPAALALLRARRPPEPSSMFLVPYTVDEIQATIKRIKKKPTKDAYGFPCDLLCRLPDIILECLCRLFNESATDGIYPSALKLIRVVPVWKGKGSKTEMGRYRPIALVPAISKIFETGLCSRLMGFLNRNKALCSEQYAYCPGRSTVCCARRLQRELLARLERRPRRRVAAVFADLSRAFDLVDHSLIIAKLEHYGVRGQVLDVFKSFLANRTQVTEVDGESSEPLSVGDRSVPQGSNVGNTLFVILMNDLPGISERATFLMYADDICAIVDGKDDLELTTNLESVIDSLTGWFSANGMQLNLEKTQVLRFSLRGQSCGDAAAPALVVGGVPLPAAAAVRFVGFTVDSALQWGQHIDALCSKLGSAYYALSRLSATLSKEHMVTAYYGYFHSLLTYGIDLWGVSADCNKPFILQKRAVRRVAGAPADAPARPLFIGMRILTVPCLYILEVLKYVKRNPNEFPDFTSGDRRFASRRPNDLRSTECRLSKTGKSLHVMGPQIFNKLPENIKEIRRVTSFLISVKNHLLKNAYYSVQEFLDS